MNSETITLNGKSAHLIWSTCMMYMYNVDVHVNMCKSDTLASSQADELDCTNLNVANICFSSLTCMMNPGKFFKGQGACNC